MKRSILAFIGSLIGLVYAACLTLAFFAAADPRALTLNVANFTVQIPYIALHLAPVALADLFNWITFASGRRGCALTAAVLYLISMPLMPALFPVALALSVLAAIDFARRAASDKEDSPPETEPEPDDESARDSARDSEPDSEPETVRRASGRDEDDRDGERADGVGVFLGLFMALALLALAGVVLYGLAGDRLPLKLW